MENIVKNIYVKSYFLSWYTASLSKIFRTADCDTTRIYVHFSIIGLYLSVTTDCIIYIYS